MTIDIKNEFNSDKDFQQYMETRFSKLFIENNSESVDQEESNNKRKGLLQWQEDEKELFIVLLKKFGRNWDEIAKELPRKTDKQCRNYF